MLTPLTSSPLIRSATLATVCALSAPIGAHAVVVAGPSGTVPTTSLSTTATTSGSASTASPAATTTPKAVAAAVVASSASTAKAAAVSPCAQCGTVQEVTARKKKGKGSGLGLIAG
ncbi:MAG TPA: hypothetical protein VFH49_01880, partial [Aquabacterium sp.]|nr:hypothetical protein [Aquabacterium sp.]